MLRSPLYHTLGDTDAVPNGLVVKQHCTNLTQVSLIA